MLGPVPDDLRFDFLTPGKSAWNEEIFGMLKRKAITLRNEMQLPERSEDYYDHLIREKFKRVKSSWSSAQPKRLRNGIMETARQVEERLNDRDQTDGKKKRHYTRRDTVRGALFVLTPILTIILEA